jgi:hypothetical protein
VLLFDGILGRRGTRESWHSQRDAPGIRVNQQYIDKPVYVFCIQGPPFAEALGAGDEGTAEILIRQHSEDASHNLTRLLSSALNPLKPASPLIARHALT